VKFRGGGGGGGRKESLPHSTLLAQALAPNFSRHSITRGVQYSSWAANPR